MIPAHSPLCRPYLNNNCSVATLPPDALPSAHQTSMAWVHLVPCDAFSQSLIYKEINGLHNNKGLNAQISMSLPHPSTTQFIPMQVTNRDPRSGHVSSCRPAQLMSYKTPIGSVCCPTSVVTRAPVEEVNSDGKANLDILSTVKYGKELLNEQLIPRRYHVPAKVKKVFCSPFRLCSSPFFHLFLTFIMLQIVFKKTNVCTQATPFVIFFSYFPFESSS